MLPETWGRARDCVDAVIRKWQNPCNNESSRVSLSAPYYHLLACFREAVMFVSEDAAAGLAELDDSDQSCYTCKVQNAFIDSLLSNPDPQMLTTFCDAVSSFFDKENFLLPRCCLPFSGELCAAFCAIYFRCWLDVVPRSNISVGFLHLNIFTLLEGVISSESLTQSDLSAAMGVTVQELIWLLLHKCPAKDADAVQKAAADITNFFVNSFATHVFTLSDITLFTNWCNSQISELLIHQNNNSLLKPPSLLEVQRYDEAILQRASWFWNVDVDFKDAIEIISKFPDGAFFVVTNSDLHVSSDSTRALLVIKTNGDVEEFFLDRKVSQHIPVWCVAGEEDSSECEFPLLVDLVQSIFTSDLAEYCELLFPVSKWIHDQVASKRLPHFAYEKLVQDVELKQAKLNQALEAAQAAFAAEQSSIQAARNNNTLRALAQLALLYEQQKDRLAGTRNAAKQNLSPEDIAKFEQANALLDARLKSIFDQRTDLESKLLNANSAQFSNLQLAMRSRLQAASLDAIKLRKLSEDDVASERTETSVSSSNYAVISINSADDSWMAPDHIDRQEAEQLLADSCDGSFLVRRRTASAWLQPGDGQDRRPYAISFKWNGSTHHIVVYHVTFSDDDERSSFYRTGYSLIAFQSISEAERSGALFSTLAELVSYYKSHPLPIDDKDSPGYGAKLMQPLCPRL